MHLPASIMALAWGLLSGSALLLGAWIGYAYRLPQRAIASVMAFGSGVLISALTFELVDDAYKRGGFVSTASGFLGGALIFTLANLWLSRRGAKHRKRSGDHQPSEASHDGSGLALAMGALLDGVPESIAIGVSMIEGGGVGLVTVIAVFLSNLPEGLSSAAGMKHAGRGRGYVYGVWGAIALSSGIASLIGYTVFQHFAPGVIAATLALAAGAILTMLADTMVPEAFEVAHDFTGLIVVAGFLAAFTVSRLMG